MIRYLTWRGRASAVYYWLRGRFVKPAPMMDRCVMGSVVDPIVHCPRRALPRNIWCAHHQRELDR